MSKGLVLKQSLKALVEDAKSIGVSPKKSAEFKKWSKAGMSPRTYELST